MIKLQVIGNLGKDCIVKEINGKSVINFSVAHTERFKDSQGIQKERTTWVECAYWTDRTAVAPYLVKGQTVYTEGTPDVDTYTNKENQTTAVLRMRVQSIQLIGNKNSDNQGGSGNNYAANTNAPVAKSATAESITAATDSADDLPF